MAETKTLTFFEASAIVTGFGVGGGIMAVPYLASLNGIIPFILVMAAAYGMSALIHLMIAEMMLRDSSTGQVIELFGKYLFRMRGGAVFTWVFFVLILMAFLANLSAYLAGGGEILRDLLAIPLWAGHVITYGVAAGVVFFGLKVIGISEKYAVAAMVLLVIFLTGLSLRLPFKAVLFAGGGLKEVLGLYGIVMFAFSALFSVPQAVQGLHWNRSLVPRAVLVGMGLNFVITLVITLIAVGVSPEVTKVAIIGWGRVLGGWGNVIGNLFIFLALLTSYWSISFALAVVLRERLKTGEKTSWLFATLPTFLIVITRFTDFLGFMGIAGSAIALLVAILVVPTLRGARKHGDVRNPAWVMGVWGNDFFQAVAIIGFLVMAVGSSFIAAL